MTIGDPMEVRITAYVSSEERDALQGIANAKRVGLSAVMRWAIEEYLLAHPPLPTARAAR